MPEFSQEALIAFFGQFAYDPMMVYLALIALMLASSFGLPVPEEITLISVGLVAYLARHPEVYPPPFEGARPVDPISLAAVAFLAVFLSDVLIYFIGRKFGRRALKARFARRLVNPRNLRRIEKWSQKYGAFATGIFRFTPGLRFPGHLSCGITRLSLTKFVAVDGIAALISVPTQILLIAYYGDEILGVIKQAKITILVIVVVALVVFLVRRQVLKKNQTA